MAKQIKRSEIAEKDLYKEIRDSAKKTVTQINKLNTNLKKTAEVIKTDLDGSLDKSLKGLNNLGTAVNKMNTTMDQSIKLDKAKSEALKTQLQAEQELEKLEQQRQKTLQSQMNTEKKLRVEKDRQAKVLNKQNKAIKDQNNAYKQLVIATRNQKNESKRLGAELLSLEQTGKKNTKEYRQLARTYKQVTAQAQKGDVQLKKLDKTVGDNFRNVGNYRGALGKLSTAMTSLGVAFSGALLIRDVFNVVKDFDQAQANLASVLGVTRTEMSALTAQAQELGSVTRFTASEVSELQLEFAKLGFTQSQIEGMTASVLDLAGATGSELGESASIVGATMRGFGLNVSETRRVTDVMAKSFSSSSLDMSKFKVAMASVAPVANLAGKTIEETTAILGVLTDRGIDASTAGTGLRNMFLQANKAGLTFDEALIKIRESTDQIGTAMELFGTRGATLGVVLANNQEDVDGLTTALIKAEGSTKTMADMQMNTLGGALDLMTSAWQGYILKVNEAGGIGDKFKDGLMFIAENLDTILNTVGRVVRAWIVYRTTMLGLKAINFITTLNMKEMGSSIARNIPLTKAYRIEQERLATSGKGVASSTSKFGKALSGIGFAIAIGLAVELAVAFYDIASGQAEARRQQDLLNGALAEGKKIGSAKADAEKDAFDENLRLINDEIRRKKALVNTDKERKKLEVERIRRLSDEADKSKGVIDDQIKNNKLLISIAKIRRDEAQQLADKVLRTNEITGKQFMERNNEKFDILEREKFVIRTLAEENKVLAESQTDFSKKLQEFVTQGIEAEADYSVKVTDNTKKVKSRNTEFSRSIDLIKEQSKALGIQLKTQQDINRLTGQTKIGNLDSQIKDENKAIQKRIELGEKVDYTVVKRLIEEREKVVIDGIRDTNKFLKNEQSRALDERFAEEKRKLNEQREKLLKQQGLTSDEKLKIEENYKDEIAIVDQAIIINKQSLNITLEAMDKKTDANILKSKKDTAEKLKNIDLLRLTELETYYDRINKQQELSLLKTKKTTEEISQEMLSFEIEQLKKKIEEYKKSGLDILDLEIELQNKIRDLESKKKDSSEKVNKEITDDQKKRAEEQIQIVSQLTEVITSLIDKRIAKIDEEIKKSQERYNTLKELAKSGNITAKESLAVEAKLIAEQNRLKEKEEKKKQRIQLASTVLQTYLKNSNDPEVKNPLAKTITDTVLLTEFIKNLPIFEKGIEDTGKNGFGIDGRGGFHAILHPNERVVPKHLNSKMGGLSNEELSKLAQDYQAGAIRDIGGSPNVAIGGWNSDQVVKKLDSLERTIKNKPETNIELEKIIDGAMIITRTTKEGNNKIYNRYKVK